MVPGVGFYPTRFTPNASNLNGRSIEGVRFVIVDRESFSSLRLGLELAVALEKLLPREDRFPGFPPSHRLRRRRPSHHESRDPRNLEPRLQETIQPFLDTRAKYLLYR